MSRNYDGILAPKSGNVLLSQLRDTLIADFNYQLSVAISQPIESPETLIRSLGDVQSVIIRLINACHTGRNGYEIENLPGTEREHWAQIQYRMRILTAMYPIPPEVARDGNN